MKLSFRRPTRFERWLALEPQAADPPLTTTDVRLPVLLVGAGPGGLAGMAALKDAGVRFVGVESHTQVGGIWDRSNPLSSVYEGMRTVTSRQTSYLGTPVSDDSVVYLPFDRVHDHFLRFAQTNGLLPQIRFQTRFVNARKTDRGTWTARLAQGDSNEEYDEEFRAIVFATGAHHRGVTTLPRDLHDQALQSGLQVLHSAEYSDPSPLAGKRVLVVGVGNSGADIADKISHVTARTLLAVRTTPWINPQTVFGIPCDKLAADAPSWLPDWCKLGFFHSYRRLAVGGYRKLGLSRPRHGLNSRLPITDRGIVEAIRSQRVLVRSSVERIDLGVVTFADPRHEPERVDAVIFATGFRRAYPLLDVGGQPKGRVGDALLFLIFHRQEPGLAYLAEAIGTRGCWPIFVDQARAIAAYFAAEQRGRPRVVQFNRRRRLPTPDCKDKMFDGADEFHVDYDIYSSALRQLADWLIT